MSSAPRRPPRSKGCAQCIQRHVKCDERSEVCRQCVRFGLPCSGPIQGPIILDMTEKVSRRSKKPNPKPRARKVQSKSDPGLETVATNATPTTIIDNFNYLAAESPLTESTSPSTQSSPHSEAETESSITSSPQYDANFAPRRDKRLDLQFQLVKLEQLYGYELFEECFVSQFVGLVTSARDTAPPDRPRSWFFSITDFLLNPSTPSVKYCIRAAALAYYSVMYHNKGAEMDAVKWYLAGLESHRNSLAHLRKASTGNGVGGPSPLRIPSSQDICVPMMFSYFECMKGSGNAWLQHMTAAVEMLIVRGPFDCRNGHEHAMFRSIRPYEAFRAILAGEHSKLSVQEWCVTPFCENVKIAFDFVIDILLSFPSQLNLPGGRTLRDSIQRVANLSDAAKDAIEGQVYCLLNKLQDWWWHFEKDNGTGVQSMDSLEVTGVSTCELPVPLPSSSVHFYRDTLTAVSIAVYNSASVILYSVLLNLASSKPPSPPEISPLPRYRSSIFSHSSSILNVAAFQNFINPYCGDTARTTFPVQIISLLGVDDAQRLEAQKYIDSWGYNHEVRDAPFDNSVGVVA
ncbi:hypothetical protein B7463_g2503, partial [Scytalidium lignicola]